METINKYFEYIFALERSKMNYSLDNIFKMSKYFGNLQNKFKSIHIAGTNGKGGTSSFLASIFKEDGLKTGLFTSPHILDFNERIRINGKKINNDYIKNFFNDNIKSFKRMSASFFEISTLLAFKYFSYKKVDIAIFETGLGGRLDSTNILKPDISIITQIGIDHTDLLGKSLVNIAKEKAGIIKPGTLTVINDTNKQLRQIFNRKASKDKIYYCNDIIKITSIKQQSENTFFKIVIDDNCTLNFKSPTSLSFPLIGDFHVKNSSAAIIVYLLFCNKYKRNILNSSIFKGLKKVINNSGYRCRFEMLKLKSGSMILDVAHNVCGIKESVINLEKLNIQPITIISLMNDKDYKSVIKEISKVSNNIIFTKANNKRAIEPKVLFKYALSQNLIGKQFYFTYNVEDAIEMGKVLRRKNDMLYFTGSFYLISEVIRILNLKKLFN
jgi:dihydrofolate synthase / folylpolyglutamate synthase